MAAMALYDEGGGELKVLKESLSKFKLLLDRRLINKSPQKHTKVKLKNMQWTDSICVPLVLLEEAQGLPQGPITKAKGFISAAVGSAPVRH
jgi:hypothetical protein